MKSTLIIIYCLITVNFATAQGIIFEKDLNWEQIKVKAKAENKYVFIDIYTMWCGPCKAMDAYVFPQKEVGDFFNRNFISLKVQQDTAKNDGSKIVSWYKDAKAIVDQFNVTAFPTYIFLSPEGIPVHKFVGLKSVEDFIKEGEDALNPLFQYTSLLKSYEDGDSSLPVLDFVRRARSLGEHKTAHRIANLYLNRLEEKELYYQDNIWLLYEFTESTTDKGFEFIQNNLSNIKSVDMRLPEPFWKAKIEQIIEKEKITPFIDYVNGNANWHKIKFNLIPYGDIGKKLMQKAETKIAAVLADKSQVFEREIKPLLLSNQEWRTILSRIQRLNIGKGEEWLIGNSIIFYGNLIVKGQDKYAARFINASKYYDSKFSYMNSGTGLNQTAWILFSSTNNYELLKYALDVANEALKLEPIPMIMDTYANLLHKLGRSLEAIQIEENALKLDPDNNEFKDTLVKMKAGKASWPEVK